MTTDPRLPFLAALERKALWLSTWTIHNANHGRESADGLKVGGHQASSASLCTIMTALYGAVLRPEDRVAVKPHASPVFHALQYLFGQQTRENLERFRGYGGAQSYPSRTKDVDDVDFSTGSVGLGVAQTLFSSLVQDYVRAKGWGRDRPEGRMVALEAFNRRHDYLFVGHADSLASPIVACSSTSADTTGPVTDASRQASNTGAS